MSTGNTAAAPAGLDDGAVLTALWETPSENETLFAASFLNVLPFSRVEAVIADLKDSCGDVDAVENDAADHRYTIRTESCAIPTQLFRDSDGKISGLLFQAPIRLDATLEDVLAEARMFDGSVSYAVYEDGTPIAVHDAERPMAVGSAFKLIVLAELRAVVDTGKARWSDVVVLEPHHISLPSGRLQNMPIGSPLTLHTLAAAMIAESDNTATDLLIDVVGRDRLEQASGLAPFLTTREMFQLKADTALHRRYASSQPAARHEILDTLKGAPLPPVEKVLGPWLAQAEWSLPVTSLCAWMGKVADLEIAQINPGVLDPSDWRAVAYKGGSQDGVLNFTTQVSDDRGRQFCVSMTWNAGSAFETDRLALLYGSVFAALRGR